MTTTLRNGQDRALDRPDDLERGLRRLKVPGSALKARVFDRFVRAGGPIGPCFVVSSARGIRHVFLASRFANEPQVFVSRYGEQFGRPIEQGRESGASRIEEALWSGNARSVALDLSRLTPFEQAVLAMTREIPRGEVRPYAWVAHEIGAPRAVRAVGSALARNPVPFLVPCHRVVRSDGLIGNYYFGPSSKETILSEEGVLLEGASTLGRDKARFVGSDSTKIVCYPTCRSARRIMDSHRMTFPSLGAAVKSGYRPCAHCRPI